MAKTVSRSSLEQMNTEELDELLREYTESPDDGSEAVCFEILDIIEQREQASPTGRIPNVDAAWADFQAYYLESDETLYPLADDAGREARKPNRQPRIRRLHRILTAAAILVILFTLLVPSALGYKSIIQMIGAWTDGTFHFVEHGPSDLSSAGTGSADALDQIDALLPTWLPEGYSLIDEPELKQDDDSQSIYYRYSNQQGDLLKYIITIYNTPAQLQNFIFEKNEQPVETYTSDGRTFYIFCNGILGDEREDTYSAAAASETMLIAIGGTHLSSADLKGIIDSIGGTRN